MTTRVLIVDDQVQTRSQIRSVLEQAGMTVVGEATNGAEAVEQYRALRPDVVTMDLVMPRLNGAAAARKILELDAEARIIMVSGLSQPSVMAEAREAGMRGFVTKPIVADDLVAEVWTIAGD